MKPYKLLHETPNHYVLHDGQKHFHVAKSGLGEETHQKIKAFANGGKTVAGDITQKENQKNMHKIDENIAAAKHHADGGMIKSPEEAGIEAVAQKHAGQSDASDTETEIEAAEAQRRANEKTQPTDYVKYNNPDKYAEGGKLTAEDRKHIAAKNFAGPDRSYPIEDASHARNALARVSQHGSPKLKAQVRAKVHAKYPGIEQSKAEGGEIQHYADGTDNVQQDNLWTSVKNAFSTPEPKTQPDSTPDRETQKEEIRRRSRLSVTDPSNMEAYAKGGYVHHNAGKNQVHLHFYDGAVVPTQLDKEEGAGPQQASPLDKYVGGEPMAEGGEASSDSDKLAQAAQEVQEKTDTQNSAIADAEADQTTPPAQDSSQNVVADSAMRPDQSLPTTTGTSEGQLTVPKNAQIPTVQKPLPPTPDQQPQMLSEFDKNLALEKQGIQEGADAQSAGYKATAQAVGQNVLEQKARMDAWKLESDKITQQNEQIYNAVASSKVDPNHFWNSKSTGGKIAAVIGVLLGGAAGGMNGGSGQNQALQKLNSQVQEDIDAQKNDTSNKMNLYKMGLERYRDAQAAQQFATLQSNALLQGTLAKIAAGTGNLQSQATAHQMIGQLGVQNAGIRSELAMRSAAMQAMNQPQQVNSGVNPDKMRLLINAGVIPKEEVPVAMKEFGEYQKLHNSLDEVDKVFTDARKDATFTQRISEGIPGGSLIPTTSDRTKKFLAETNSLLDKYTKDLTGRVTPQSMQNLHYSIPQAGDSPDVMARKLNSFKDIVREAYSFPTLESYRLLHPNDPTINSSATRQKKFTEGPPK